MAAGVVGPRHRHKPGPGNGYLFSIRSRPGNRWLPCMAYIASRFSAGQWNPYETDPVDFCPFLFGSRRGPVLGWFWTCAGWLRELPAAGCGAGGRS